MQILRVLSKSMPRWLKGRIFRRDRLPRRAGSEVRGFFTEFLPDARYVFALSNPACRAALRTVCRTFRLSCKKVGRTCLHRVGTSGFEPWLFEASLATRGMGKVTEVAKTLLDGDPFAVLADVSLFERRGLSNRDARSRLGDAPDAKLAASPDSRSLQDACEVSRKCRGAGSNVIVYPPACFCALPRARCMSCQKGMSHLSALSGDKRL